MYILLDRPDGDGAWGCYVGKAPAGLRSRLVIHLREKDHWVRAILIQRDTTHGFNSAHTAWLEGRLYDLFDAAASSRLHNKQRPGDDTLAPYDRLMLEAAIDPISRTLRLIGYDPAPAEDPLSPKTTPTTPRVYYGATISDLITAGLLSPPIRVVSTLSTAPGEGTILLDGQIKTAHGTYPNPSTAGSAFAGRAVNGWDYWAIETDSGKVRLSTLRARMIEQAAAPAQQIPENI